MSGRSNLKSIESNCDGSDHSKYCVPCSVCKCADCGGSLCQKFSLYVQLSIMNTGLVCEACAGNYEQKPERFADAIPEGYWKKPVVFNEARYNSARIAFGLPKDASVYDVLVKHQGYPHEVGVEY